MEVHALKGISIEIQSGEFVSIMGPSGSGKSTFMNILGCLDRPSCGQYFLDGISLSQITNEELANIRNSKIGFVFQNFNLLVRTTALENVELPMIYNNTPSRQRSISAREALSIVGLDGRENHYPSQLSGGQQQRVAIARAIVNNPSIIMADEPTGNLDSKTTSEIMKIFESLNKHGKTIIVITHENDVAKYAKSIIVFKDGSIQEENYLKNSRRNGN